MWYLLFVDLRKIKNMDLKEYIEKSLYSIIASVVNVQKGVSDLGVVVYPSTIKDDYIDIHGKRKVMNIKFDVAVTVDEKNGKEKGFSIKVVELISGGIKATENSQNQSVSRINFEIPVAMPVLDELTEDSIKKIDNTMRIISSYI